MSRFLIVFFALVCSMTSAHAQTRTEPVALVPSRTIVLPPEKASPAAVPRFEAAPIIDGQLDDVAESDFYMKGGIDEVLAAAKKA